MSANYYKTVSETNRTTRKFIQKSFENMREKKLLDIISKDDLF